MDYCIYYQGRTQDFFSAYYFCACLASSHAVAMRRCEKGAGRFGGMFLNHLNGPIGEPLGNFAFYHLF